ncbi:MAG TPA: SLBB domain-containing protein [Polyangia bacterium]|nr:SLBB domain-containing protein [Polyangia bacterium]
MPAPDLRLLPRAAHSTYDAYLAAVGASAVEKARKLAPEVILRELRASGLRGRGGAGFPTGTKWTSVHRNPCPIRYVVVNAAEGEPGTFKDRWLLRQNPYAMLEGMLIAAHVVGARAAYIAMKRSFTRELDRVRRAVEEMTAAGIIDADTSVQLVEGPEEYLFGEEKALLNVVEGSEPLPRTPDNPPYEVGLFATPSSPNPALVNNVETMSHVAGIVRHGADAFRARGTADTPGTLLVTISGDVARPGVYEVDAGTPLDEVLETHAGGPRPGRKFVLALSGVSTAPLAAERFHVPLEFGALQHAGAGLGSAGFVLVDDAASIPRVAQSVARFLYVESCNQCSACKAGLRLASRAIDEIFDPALATPDDPERALFGAASAPQGNRCYLPVQGSILIPSLLRRYAAAFSDQVAHPSRETAPWPIPKLVDYDETARAFRYDERQALKQPDWTYREPSAPAPKREAPRPRAAVAVRLAPDLAARLHEAAESSGLELDRQVDAALREWLAARGSKP